MRTLRLLFVAVLLLSILPPASAQTDVNLAQGLEPYKTYMAGNVDAVSLTNGNVSLHIPLVSYPQRGGRLTLGFFLRYNNKAFRPSSTVWTFDGVGVDVQREQLWETRVQQQKLSVPGDNGTATIFVRTTNGRVMAKADRAPRMAPCWGGAASPINSRRHSSQWTRPAQIRL
jgi:hypothetical protein